MLQRIIDKIAGQSKIFCAFATDKKEIAGYLQTFYWHFHQLAFGQLADYGWFGHKAQALIG
jgi:hypothetical protein